MSTIPPRNVVERPYNKGYRYGHEDPEKRVVYVAYRCPPYPTWFGGTVIREAELSRDVEHEEQAVWTIVSAAKSKIITPRLDDEILHIDEQTFRWLQASERKVWWPAYEDYRAGVLAIVHTKYDEADMEWITIPARIRAAIDKAAERAANRSILEDEGLTAEDLEVANDGTIKVVRGEEDLGEEYHDVDDLVDEHIAELQNEPEFEYEF